MRDVWKAIGWQILRRGWADTWRFIAERHHWIYLCILGVFGWGLDLYWRGYERALDEGMTTLLHATLPIVGLGLLLLVWNLWLAPYRLLEDKLSSMSPGAEPAPRAAAPKPDYAALSQRKMFSVREAGAYMAGMMPHNALPAAAIQYIDLIKDLIRQRAVDVVDKPLFGVMIHRNPGTSVDSNLQISVAQVVDVLEDRNLVPNFVGEMRKHVTRQTPKP